MSSYVALLDGGKREAAIEVTPVGPGLYDVRVGETVHRVDVFRHDAATMSLLIGAESYAVQLDPRASELRVRVRGATYPIDLLDERRLRLRRAGGRFTLDGKQVLTAPMPGKVVKVLAKAGDAVKAGQGLLVIEAMKMENEMKSPKDGKLVELAVAEGQAVENGAVLAAVE
jgi:biotin carboxyl carrier protein